MNLRPSGYEPDELPGCSTPRQGRVFYEKREGSDKATGPKIVKRSSYIVDQCNGIRKSQKAHFDITIQADQSRVVCPLNTN